MRECSNMNLCSIFKLEFKTNFILLLFWRDIVRSFGAISALLCSSSIVYGMVPFLNAILGTMLPMLNMAKQDNMKWVFSSGKILLNTLSAVQLLKHETFLKMSPLALFDIYIFFVSLQLCVISVTVSWSISPI